MVSKIIITGAAGFIGFNLFKKIKEKYDILGIDNFNDYYDQNLKNDRVFHYKLNVQYCDITDKEQLNNIFSFFRPDLVIHLGAMVGPRHSVKNQLQYHRVNIDGTQNIIDVCEKYDVKKVVYASTSSVCSGVKELPWREDMLITYPSSPYGYTKFVNECQFKMSNLCNVGLRLFSVYGPWGRPDTALFNFTKKIVKDEIIEVFNYGNMKRDFTYIDDVVEGIKIIIENDYIRKDEIFNIGSGTQVNLIDFVNEIEKYLKKEAKIVKAPIQNGDTLETLSDISKLCSLGYQPKTNISDGICNFIDWYKWYYKIS